MHRLSINKSKPQHVGIIFLNKCSPSERRRRASGRDGSCYVWWCLLSGWG